MPRPRCSPQSLHSLSSTHALPSALVRFCQDSTIHKCPYKDTLQPWGASTDLDKHPRGQIQYKSYKKGDFKERQEHVDSQLVIPAELQRAEVDGIYLSTKWNVQSDIFKCVTARPSRMWPVPLLWPVRRSHARSPACSPAENVAVAADAVES